MQNCTYLFLRKVLKDILYRRRSLFGLLLIFWAVLAKAQTVPVGTPVLEDHHRRQQLLGVIDSNISFTVRPLPLITDSVAEDRKKPVFKLLPLSLQQQVNTHHPYGWNDGLMVPAKGYQAHISGGVFTRLGPLSIQLQPEFIYALNPDLLRGNDLVSSDSYAHYISGGADIPGYYWNKNYTLFNYGQSSVRLTFDPVSLGVSSENLWWGPGRRNALVMSNNARGFKHLTFNTSRPVNTPVGAVEGQIIAGQLENSDDILNLSKRDEWRYLSGMVISYQPRWVPGFFLGFTRVFQMYNTDVQTGGDYFPLLQPFEKKKTSEDSKRRDQISSVFARWVFPRSQSEVYFEFGRNDHSHNLRDFFQLPEHSRAYLVGFQKMVDLPNKNEKILIATEMTQMAQPPGRLVREAGTWYTHSQITHGLTHRGEVLAAGIGPGASLQSFEISWLNDFKRLGFLLERYEHNRDYYLAVIDPSNTSKGQWVDLSGTLLGNWNYKQVILSGRISGIQSLNYLWQSGYDHMPQKNPFNLHVNLSATYFFK